MKKGQPKLTTSVNLLKKRDEKKDQNATLKRVGAPSMFDRVMNAKKKK